MAAHREERVLGGHPRYCVCTNASRGLSAIAEFLVYTLNTFVKPLTVRTEILSGQSCGHTAFQVRSSTASKVSTQTAAV